MQLIRLVTCICLSISPHHLAFLLSFEFSVLDNTHTHKKYINSFLYITFSQNPRLFVVLIFFLVFCCRCCCCKHKGWITAFYLSIIGIHLWYMYFGFYRLLISHRYVFLERHLKKLQHMMALIYHKFL